MAVQFSGRGGAVVVLVVVEGMTELRARLESFLTALRAHELWLDDAFLLLFHLSPTFDSTSSQSGLQLKCAQR